MTIAFLHFQACQRRAFPVSSAPRMKTRLITCLTLLVATTVCLAGPDSEKIASELLDAGNVKTSLEDGFMGSIRPGLEQLKANGGDDALVKEMMDVAKKFYDDNFHWALAKPQIAKAYAAELSDEDMKAITAFYQSPAGKIATTKLPQIARKGTDTAMAGLQAKMPELQNAIVWRQRLINR